ncbi:MAG: hypothetical protein M0Z96_06460 [Actinomycetota bacterium]|nr:hypothetical protein [Actinomycetota bacterium]
MAFSLHSMFVSFVGENLYVGDYAVEGTADLKKKLKIDLERNILN